ncbi:universal stress protein [uncultured Bartonella sp.]|uniref:universal stress protein n=1 Tax=uncultured Bartonella sp. TaxID=104108 RepID=UPI0025E6BC31|nr:universal stress protein [uncultured Bartonella sp.]
MLSKRLSRQYGHKRKFLAVIDETPECRRAVAYASRRAKNTNGTLILLYVIDSSEFQHFLGVGNIMRAEAEEQARQTLSDISADVRENLGIETEIIVCEGQKAAEISKLIENDQDIAVLVLAAGSGAEGPGPLVQSIAAKGSAFPIPVTIIPDGLSAEDIDSVA